MTDQEAIDEMNALVEDTWQANVSAIVGSQPFEETPRWKDKDISVAPEGYYIFVSQQIVAQDQVSMADENTFGNNLRRYETNGILFIQLFAPKAQKNASKRGRALSEALRNALASTGQTGIVWYRRARINDLPDDGKSYRFNVVAEFSYDDIR